METYENRVETDLQWEYRGTYMFGRWGSVISVAKNPGP